MAFPMACGSHEPRSFGAPRLRCMRFVNSKTFRLQDALRSRVHEDTVGRLPVRMRRGFHLHFVLNPLTLWQGYFGASFTQGRQKMRSASFYNMLFPIVLEHANPIFL